MECPNCDANNVENFFQEKIGCPHCGEIVNVEYYMCSECGSTFKMTGDEIYSNIQFSKDEFRNLFGGTMNEVSKRFSTDMMLDNISTCVACGSLTFEIEEGLYKCSKCGMEVSVEVIE